MQQSKKFMTKPLPVFLALMGMLMVACNTTNPTQPDITKKAPLDKQVLVSPEVGISDIKTFDPALSTDSPSIQAIDNVFTGLVQLNDKLAIMPQLAASFSEGSDGLTWTFKLKPNLKFSDGTPLTSQDVVYSIDRALQPANKSVVAPLYLALIKDSDKLNAGKIKTIIGDSLLTPDPNTVVIKANKKATYFLDALVYSTSYVVEKSLVDKYGANFTDHLNEGGGDGPFKVQTYTHGKNIVLVPNPNYYGPKPQLTKLVYPFYKENSTAYKAYQSGELDYTDVPSADLASAKSLPNNQYMLVPQLWINYYTMNYLVKPFDNIHIRQAFALAVNKDLIAHSVYKDTVVASNHIVPQGMPGYNPNLTGPEGVASTKGDPAKAKALLQQGLQEEGWSSVPQMPAIQLTYPSGTQDLDNEIAAVVQMWQTNLGVSVKANAEDFNKLLTDTEAALNNPKGLQFWELAWIADYPDPQDWTTLQFGKGALYSQVLKPYVKGLVFNPQLLIPPDDWGNVYVQAH